MPLPKRSDSRRSDTTSESRANLLPSSVRLSVPSRSSCALFRANLLLSRFLLMIRLLTNQARAPPGKPTGWVLTDQRPFLFSLAYRAVSSALLSSLRNSWEYTSCRESDKPNKNCERKHNRPQFAVNQNHNGNAIGGKKRQEVYKDCSCISHCVCNFVWWLLITLSQVFHPFLWAGLHLQANFAHMSNQSTRGLYVRRMCQCAKKCSQAVNFVETGMVSKTACKANGVYQSGEVKSNYGL